MMLVLIVTPLKMLLVVIFILFKFLLFLITVNYLWYFLKYSFQFYKKSYMYYFYRKICFFFNQNTFCVNYLNFKIDMKFKNKLTLSSLIEINVNCTAQRWYDTMYSLSFLVPFNFSKPYVLAEAQLFNHKLRTLLKENTQILFAYILVYASGLLLVINTFIKYGLEITNLFFTLTDTYTLKVYYYILLFLDKIFIYLISIPNNIATYILTYINLFKKYYLSSIYSYSYYLLVFFIGYFTVIYILPNNYIVIKFNILKYFYNSLFLHTLFVYGLILSTLFTCCTVHFDYFLELYHSMYYTLRMIWSTFFYTPEDFDEYEKQKELDEQKNTA